MFKKWDIIIIIFLIIISFLPEVIFGIFLKKDYNRTYAVVTVNGKFYKNIPLSEHTGESTFTIKENNGYNEILVKDNFIGIKDADCSDSICIDEGFISKPGETIVCLPHKVLIEIKGEYVDEDDIILSH